MLVRLVKTRYHKIPPIVLRHTVSKTFCVKACEYVDFSMCVCIYPHMCALFQRFGISDIISWYSNKQLLMTCGYITINNAWIHTYIYIYIYIYIIHSGGWWKLISSAGKPEHKWLYWNPQNSCSGYQLMNPVTWVTIFDWSPYL